MANQGQNYVAISQVYMIINYLRKSMCLICICGTFFFFIIFINTAVDGTMIPLIVVSLVIDGCIQIFFKCP